VLRYIFAAVFLLNSLIAASSEKAECPRGKRHYRAGIRHIESGGIGYSNGYTTFELFLSSDPSHWRVTPFWDAKGHIFDNGKWAANTGVGIRSLWKDRAYGLNLYYDYRNTGRFHSNQLGLGLETLGELFDARLNGYFPVGRTTSPPYDSVFGGFSGNSLQILQKMQTAMQGANAELGFHFGKSELFAFYAAAGPYYFIGEAAPATWGGKARLSGTFREMVTVEISDSYDRTFRNKFQGQIALNFSFGPRSKIEKHPRGCKAAITLNDRMLQPVERQEIIVVDTVKKREAAINPATGFPYSFVFVDNTSNSNGTYESPYPTLTQAQDNSSANAIIYVFPGDGTSTGMNTGIALKASQKLWGSGVGHLISTSAGTISIPPQSSTSPTITNSDADTEGNAITLASNNAISGFTILSPLNDGIYGSAVEALEISFCSFQDSTTYAIEAAFPEDASISLTNNQFLNNANGAAFTLNGSSTLLCANNTFEGQTSVSNTPLEIIAANNAFTARLENNLFQDNTTGSVRLDLTNVASAAIHLLNNTITDNGTGAQASLGSSVVLLSTGTIGNCSIAMTGNTFDGNTSNALYLHTSGEFTALTVTASENTISNLGGSGFVLAAPVDILTLSITDNTLTACDDNGIAVIDATATTTTGTITISGNLISEIGNASNGIAINQNFSSLDLSILNNQINGCEGTGIISYAPVGIDTLTMVISGNTIDNCQNLSSNAASGIDIEQYTNLAGSITDNTLSGNAGTAVAIGTTTLAPPTVCLTLSGNDNSANYSLTNPDGGVFRLSPCNASALNVGTIDTSGTIDLVQSCPDGSPCPP